MGAGVGLVEGDELGAVAVAGGLGVDHQGVQHHHLLIGGGMLPGRALVDIHLLLVDDGGAHHLAIGFGHEEIAAGQGSLGSLAGGVDAADPADGGQSLLLGGVDGIVDISNGGDVAGGGGTDVHGHSS